MVGEQLTCIWQAVNALSEDGSTNSFPGHQFKKLLSSFSGFKSMQFSDFKFDLFFADQTFSFDKVKEYVSKELRAAGAPEKMLYDDIELACWNACKGSYGSRLREKDLMKLWKISNRMVMQDTYPPLIGKDEVRWFSEKITSNLNERLLSVDPECPEEGLTFQHWIGYLDSTVFKNVDETSLTKCIDDMYCWLVKEVLKFGWMHKRTKKQANWTSWTSRWFVLTPGKLQYFKSDSSYKRSEENLKGEAYITGDSKVEIRPAYKGFMRSYPYRFKVTNQQSVEYELALDNENEMKKWLACLEEIIKCCSLKTTPIQKLLKSRHNQSAETEEKLERTLRKTVKFRKFRKKGDKDLNGEVKPTPIPQIKEEINSQKETPAGGHDLLKREKEKIKGVFLKIDTDGNGLLNCQEFSAFLDGLGVHMTEKEVNLVFNSIDKDKNGTINFDEFATYFAKHILNENGTGKCVTALRKAFLEADQSGSGTLDFKEFTEYIWERKRSMRISTILGAFQTIGNEGKGELDFEDFKNILVSSDVLLSTISEEDENAAEVESLDSFDNQLRHAFDETESKDLALYIRDRWKNFASFRRPGANGEIVMKGGHGMVDDLVPGDYNLVDLVCFSDLPPLEPKHTTVPNVQWRSSTISGKSGKVIFPMDFNGKIVTDIATNEHLRYYNCSIADSKQEKVSLVYRHGIQDFTYENHYLSEYVTKANGGAGIEKHEFSHLDCPLVEDSGIFILAKMVGNDLHITGFRVPIRHTLYIPGGSIHSNDYLKGTWRTMLSDETDIDHVHLTRNTGAGNGETLEHFAFEFC